MCYQRLLDPQQWNMYSYTRNNPLIFVDPDGKELRWASGQTPAQMSQARAILVEAYRHPTQRASIKAATESAIKNNFGVGQIQGTEPYVSPGRNEVVVNSAAHPDPAKTTNDITIDPDSAAGALMTVEVVTRMSCPIPVTSTQIWRAL